MIGIYIKKNLTFADKYKDKVTGGTALEYFMDVRLKLNSRGTYKEKKENTLGEVQDIETESRVNEAGIRAQADTETFSSSDSDYQAYRIAYTGSGAEGPCRT